MQRTAVIVLNYSFAKDCGLVLSYSFALISAIHSQRLWFLFSAIHLQRTAVFDFCHSFTKGLRPLLTGFNCKGLLFLIVLFCLLLCICKGLHPCSTLSLQRTAVLVFCYLHAKDCCSVFSLFVCKGLSSMFSVFCLQLIAVVVSC